MAVLIILWSTHRYIKKKLWEQIQKKNSKSYLLHTFAHYT